MKILYSILLALGVIALLFFALSHNTPDRTSVAALKASCGPYHRPQGKGVALVNLDGLELYQTAGDAKEAIEADFKKENSFTEPASVFPIRCAPPAVPNPNCANSMTIDKGGGVVYTAYFVEALPEAPGCSIVSRIFVHPLQTGKNPQRQQILDLFATKLGQPTRKGNQSIWGKQDGSEPVLIAADENGDIELSDPALAKSNAALVNARVADAERKHQQEAATEKAREDRQARGRYIMKHGFGCKDEDVFSKYFEYAVQNDRELATRFLSENVLTGECTIFKDGEEVVLAHATLLTRKVRRPGSMDEYWVDPTWVQQ